METANINIVKSIRFSSWGDTGYIKIPLTDGWEARFFSSESGGRITISSADDKFELGKFVLPSHLMVSAVGLAMKHPDAFYDSLSALGFKQ